MIFPMMLAVDFSSIGAIRQQPRGLLVTALVNWLIKPFTMTALAWLFIRGVFSAWIRQPSVEYVAGMILLGVAPCTAMVFVWSRLDGDPNYTLAQVALNDLVWSSPSPRLRRFCWGFRMCWCLGTRCSRQWVCSSWSPWWRMVHAAEPAQCSPD